MRFTNILFKQHIGFMFKKHWHIKREKKLFEDKAGLELARKGVKIIDAVEFIQEKKPQIVQKPIPLFDKPLPKDKNHPDYHEKVCHILDKTEVLVEGLEQAQVLTNTVCLDVLPEHIENFANDTIPNYIHDQVQKCILYANVFDCEQGKLPKYVNPERPYHNYARKLGITDVHRSSVTVDKLISILEKNSKLSNQRFIAHLAELITSFNKNSDLIQLKSSSDLFISSNKPLKPISEISDFTNFNLPNLNPLKYTVTMKETHFYDMEDVYRDVTIEEIFTTVFSPSCTIRQKCLYIKYSWSSSHIPYKIFGDQKALNKLVKAYHPHTSFLHFNETQVKNIYETPVLEKQIWGRSLIHAFTIASSYAKSIYGFEIQTLPVPVTVQCIQSNGCNFYFGVYQLNTLNLNSDAETKNIWYSVPKKSLFNECKYASAIPVLSDYDPKVLNYLSAFYNSE